MPEVIGKVTLPDEKGLKFSKEEIQEVLENYALKKLSSEKIMGVFADGFAVVEHEEIRVADVVIGPGQFNMLRKYGRDSFSSSNLKDELQRGLFGLLWGARLWVKENATDINCYGEGSEQLEKDFPFIAESKRALGME